MNKIHTEGPWFVIMDKSKGNNECLCHNIVLKENAPHTSIADVWSSNNHVIKDALQGRANATLIAASPEMLEILSELISDLEEINLPTSINDTINRAKSLIAKATTI